MMQSTIANGRVDGDLEVNLETSQPSETPFNTTTSTNSGKMSIASKLPPLVITKQKLDQMEQDQVTLCHLNRNQSSKIEMFQPYPSTVVTMTNNIATIRRHSNLMAGYGVQRNLVRLITNVLNSERHITSVLASVGEEGEEEMLVGDNSEELSSPSTSGLQNRCTTEENKYER